MRKPLLDPETDKEIQEAIEWLYSEPTIIEE